MRGVRLALALAPLAALLGPPPAEAVGAASTTSVSVHVLNRDETLLASVSGSGYSAGTTVSLGPGVQVDVTSRSATRLVLRISVGRNAVVGPRSLSVTVPGSGTETLHGAVRVAYAPILARWAVGQGAAGWTTSLVRPAFGAPPRVSFSGSGVDVAAESLGAHGALELSLSVAEGSAASWRTMTLTEGVASWVVPRGLKVRAAPRVDSVTPLGAGETNVPVLVRGKGFENCGPTDEPTLAVGGSGVTVNRTSAALGTLLYANLTVAAGAAPGPRTVTLTNCDSGGVGIAPDGFTVLGAPTVSSAPPIAVGVTRTEVFRGTGFTPVTTLVASGAGVTLSDVAYVSATRMRATVAVQEGAAIGARDVTASDPGGMSTTADGVLAIDGLPTLASTSQGGLGANRATVTTLTGSGFQAGAAVEVLRGGVADREVKVSPARVESATSLEVLLAGSGGLTLGSDELVVVNPDGGQSGPVAFVTDPAPSLVSLHPSPTTAGSVDVDFDAPAGAPPDAAYSAKACTNAAMSTRCVSVAVAPGGAALGGLSPGVQYFVSIAAAASGTFYGSTSDASGVRATRQLGAPAISKVTPSTAAAGEVVVTFSGAAGAPASQRYEAVACRNKGMSVGCVSGAVVSGHALAHLVAGATYLVEVRALASQGYLAATSSPSAGVLATLQLAAPVVTSAVWSSGQLDVRFTGPAVHPGDQRYSLLACANAAMTSGCVRIERVRSGELVAESRARPDVVVVADASAGYLASRSAVTSSS